MKSSLIKGIAALVDLVLGISSLVFIVQNQMVPSSACVLIAALCHWFGAKAAKETGAGSDTVSELMSSLIVFGAAPAVAAWKLSLADAGVIGYLLLIAFTCCSSIRLSRPAPQRLSGSFYTGIPVTLAGAFVALDDLVVLRYGAHTLFSAVFMFLLSYLMVSSADVEKN